MSVDVVKLFTAMRKTLDRESIHRLIEELGLFPSHEGLDYVGAYKVLGKDCVDEWIKMGTFADSSDPIAFENLDHWRDPESRKKYYEEHLAKQTGLRRTGSMCVKLHPNFTIAEIEHATRNK